MSKFINRGVFATFAAGALTLSLAPVAMATPDDSDGRVNVSVPEETAQSAEVFRIADSTRITTAIEASQSRTDWGRDTNGSLDPNARWDCEAPTQPFNLDGTPVPAPYAVGDRISVINGIITGQIDGTVRGQLAGEIDGTVNGLIFGELAGALRGDIDGTIDADIAGDVTGLILGLIAGEFGADFNGELDGDAAGVLINFPGPVDPVLLDVNGDVVGTIDGELFAVLLAQIAAELDAELLGNVDAELTGEFLGDFLGEFFGGFEGGFEGFFGGRLVANFDGELNGVAVVCEAIFDGTFSGGEGLPMDIIVARADDYPDALSAGPLADVLNAPILLNPTDSLNADVAAEITRLGSLGGARSTTVHVLGGTNAISGPVAAAILGLPAVNDVVRYQGIDRYQTATSIAAATVNWYGIQSGADLEEVNAYLTTGINFPDALAAGAAAAFNDGVVLLTDGETLDRRGFTEDFLENLQTIVELPGAPNTTENFAVGGPSARAAAAFDIRLAPNGAYVGANRYETATLTATATFGPVASGQFAVVSGETFPDALVAGGYIANLDGPLLLTKADSLSPVTAAYLTAVVMNGDRIFTFGGPDALKASVTAEIAAVLEAKFAIDDEIR